MLGNHVLDIMLPKIQNFDINDLIVKGNLPEVPPMSGKVMVSKSLRDVILTSTTRNKKMYDESKSD